MSVPSETMDDMDQESDDQNPIDTLLKYLESNNLADELEDYELGRIGQKVVEEFTIDLNSRSEWETKTEEAMKLAKQVSEDKNYPWPKAANVKYPLITTAALQFNATAYPAIVQGNNIVKAKVVGRDQGNEKASRAARISEHMSYQVLEEMPEWEPDVDRALLTLPIVGTDFKKTYYDPEKGRNVSIRVSAKNFVVNNKAKALETVPRCTEVFTLYPHEITEKCRFGVFRDLEYPHTGKDDYEPVEFLEQHRMLDLDEDGYPEPYIVTVHKETSQVARIVCRFDPEEVMLVDESKTDLMSLAEYQKDPKDGMKVAKIWPIHYYTKYGFFPDPEGGFYDIGLGFLLNPMNESINTVLNQLLDAGHLANTGGGFIGRGMRMKRGEVRFKPGEYKSVEVSGDDIRKNIVPLQFSGPSAVLFNLLGMLIDAAKNISSVQDVMTGDSHLAMAQPTTVMALIEQGQKVFSSIYKRLYRSFSEEFKKLYRLNSIYLEETAYYRVLDDQKAIARKDYAEGDCDVVPVSDPNLATDQQKLGRANFLGQFLNDPFFNPLEIRRRILESARIEDIEKILQQPQDKPDIGLMVKMAELENKRAEIDNDTRMTNAKIIEAIANAALHMEQGEAVNAGVQLDTYRTYLQAMIQGLSNDQRGISGMENAPGNGMGVTSPPERPQGADGGMGQGRMPMGGEASPGGSPTLPDVPGLS